MKNISRILALVLALTMVIGAFASVSAAGSKWYDKAVAKLKSVGIADVALTAEEKITRAEFALMVAKIDSGWVNTQWWDESVLANTVVFKDQADTDKAHRAAICYCYQRSLVAGDGDGNYRPNSVITLAEASVVITRLMGYENDVPQNGDQWQYNWMYTANKYCRAFDATFMANVDSVNPDYELSNGEAAYLLATILNFLKVDGEADRLTKKGEDLGKNFKPTTTSSDLVRVTDITMDSKEVLVDTTKTIELTILSTGEAYTVSATQFEKLVRKSLGLTEDRDLTTTDRFNLGDYVQKNTLLYAERKNGALVSVSLFNASTKVEANTYLVAAKGSAHTYNTDGSIKTVGDVPKFANASGSDATPQLRKDFTSATYEVDGVKKYANEITFSGNKVVFKGASESAVEYTVVDSLNTLGETELVVYNVDGFTTMTAAQFKAAIPNLAKGEYKVTFYDIDADGYYDAAVFYSSAEFVNKTGVTFDTSKNTVTATVTARVNDSKAYKTIQLGTISAGVMAAVDTSGYKTIGGKEYYVVTMANIGAETEIKTVYVPVERTVATRTVKYAIEGYTVTATVDSSAWTPFLKQSTAGTANDKLDATAFRGLVYNKAVKYVLAGDIDSTLTGDAANVVVYVVDTASASAAAKGFIVKVEKSETGNNTFNVTVATTGAYSAKGTTKVYFDNVLDARFSYIRSISGNWTNYATDTGLTNANSNWTVKNVTPRLALTYLGFDADEYLEVGKTRNLNPELTNHAGTKIWVDWANGNSIAYARNILTNEKVGATEANLADILGKTLKELDAMMDETVVDTQVTTGEGDTAVTTTTPAIEIAETKKTAAWNFLVNLCKSTRILDIEKDANGARKYDDDYATAKALYEESTFGALLAEFEVYGLNVTTFTTNVVTNYQNVATNLGYGYYLCFIDRIFGSGLAEGALFDVNASGKTFGWNNEKTAVAKYLDAIVSATGATGVKTYEVRASASVLWDVENTAIYNRIFATTTNTVRPGVEGEKVTGEDLIYVSIIDDASAQYVLKYDAAAYEDGNTAYVAIQNVQNPKNSNNFGFTNYNWADKGTYVYRTSTTSVKDSWDAYKSYIFLDDVNVAAVEKLAKEAFATGNGLTELDDGTKVFTYTTTDTRIAVNPYYLKTPNGANKYERWWEIGTVTVNFTATHVYSGEITTYIPVTDDTGAQIKVLTDAEKLWWETQTKDAAGMDAKYVVIDKLLYRVNTVVSAPKYDTNGKPVVEVTYVADTAGVDFVPAKVADTDLAKVHTVSNRLLDIKADADIYQYGEYEVKFDGQTYYAFSDATVIVMTPNPVTGNIDGQVTTLGQFIAAKKDLFVTSEQVYYTMDGNAKILKALTVIGEYTDGIKKDDGVTEPTTKTVTVYLGKNGATVETTEHGTEVVVKSTYSAVTVPSGEAFGQIYRTYKTYAEAIFNDIETAMPTGFYTVDESGKILSVGATTKKGYITDSDIKGNVKVKLTADAAETSGAGYNWQFFYTDFEGNFVKAGESTSVAIVSQATIDANLQAKKDAIVKAQNAYDAIDSKYVAAKAAAKEAVVKAEQALEDYKASVIKANRDGQFWGVANSAVYTYFTNYRYTYQKNPAPVEFQYIVIDGVYCVLVNTIEGE